MKRWMIFVGPILAVVAFLFLRLSETGFESSVTAAITVWVAAWWITEPISIGATSLIPLALFPIFGILSPEQVALAYGNKLILLMLGGFMISAALERSNTHKRIALTMVNQFGSHSPRRLVFGFMAASAFLSMWISNAATSVMLLPMVMAVISQTTNHRLHLALLLGTAYAASIGGIATPIGTPPNLVFMGVYQEAVGTEVGFLQWMGWALPIVLVMLPLAGFWLTRHVSARETIQLPGVGKWRVEEKRVLAIFGVTAMLWMTRAQPFGGWSSAIDALGFKHSYANDGTVALLGALALFLVPNGKGENLLDWNTARKIPWGILILFAGGLAIASAFKSSGLSEQLGERLALLGSLPPLLLIGTICLVVTFLTEVTSNTATTTLLLPILATASIESQIDARVYMVPATISASFAFMLPVATPPNAIMFGSEKFSIQEMVREGVFLNLLGVIVVTTVCYLLFH